MKLHVIRVKSVIREPLYAIDALGLPGAEEARGYIQHWWQSLGGRSDVEIPEGAAHRIISAANVILTAGREAPAGEEA